MCFFKRRPKFFRRLFHKPSASGPDGEVYVTSDDNAKTKLNKKQLLSHYQVHIFVGALFVSAVLFVSLGWYYRDLSREEELSKQKIFIDPSRRVLTLSDDRDEIEIRLGRDLPGWQLPLHCPAHPDGNPHSKECVWKDNAVLHVHYFVLTAPDSPEDKDPPSGGGPVTAECYNVSWTTLQPNRVPYDCFGVGNAEWYGPSNQSGETLPIRGQFEYIPGPYHLHHAGIFSSAVDLYWLSSTGVGILLNPNDPLTLHWNVSGSRELCVISNYSGPLYGDTHTPPSLNYTVCNGPDPVQTHLMMKPFLRSSAQQGGQKKPSVDLFGMPQWSVSGVAQKTDYDQHDVLDLITRIKMHGLNCSLLMLDGDWQQSHGDLTFDPTRFANLTNMTDTVTDTCTLGLQVSPYFDYRSINNFHQGVSQELFVRDAGGQVPGLMTRWYKGPAVAMLDVSKPASREWFTAKLKSLLSEAQAQAVRLSYGSDGWLPYKATFSQANLSLFQLRTSMAHMVSSLSSRLVLEHTAGSQRLQGFVSVPTQVGVRGGRPCLMHTIETALTLGLMGYPYVLADGFPRPSGSNSRQQPFSNTARPSKDLFTRWMQMAAFFPALQFSLPPWMYDTVPVGSGTGTGAGGGGQEEREKNSVTGMAARLTNLHVDIMAELHGNDKLMEELQQGLPMLRPVWWLDAGNVSLHALHVHDQFLLGDQVLVAPVLCEGVTQRSIYVPPGVWKDKLRGAVVVGPKVLEDYHVALHEVPYFQRMKTYDDHKRN